MAKPLTVYDGHTMKRLAYLQNAYNISYTQPINALWTASFKLPFGDYKTKYCESFNLIEIWDIDGGGGDRYIGLFRILPQTEESLGVGAYIEYRLEHVLSTLLDDVMLGWHEIGDTEVYTSQAIAYILEQQSQSRWVLQRCDYEHEYLYGWQDENLLSALYSIVTPFSETDYYWDFDTTVYPWQLRLQKVSPIPVTDIRYKKNLSGVVKTVDPSNLTTRLYCYGYGDGDNKLGIAEINDDIPYLESPNVSKYGIITQVWTDEKITIAESLKAVGEAMLKKLEEPAITYDINIQTVYNAANLRIGDTVRVVTGSLDEYMIVKQISKDDLTGAPRSGQIVVGNGTVDISSSMAELADRQRISETYSQGSESIFMDSYMDNADTSNPIEATFIIPENAVHVNEIRFNARLTPFRAYSRAIKGGGSGVTTTEAGGGSTPTTYAGGGIVNTQTGQGGSSTPTTTSGGQVNTTSEYNSQQITTSSYAGEASQSVSVSYVLAGTTSGPTVHNHGVPLGTVIVTNVVAQKNTSGYVTDLLVYTHPGWVPSGDHYHSINIPSHTHTVTIPQHNHSINIGGHNHYVTVPSHTHTISLESHTHSVPISPHSHQISLPNHTHDIEYGIYKGPSGSSMTIYLDDVSIGTYSASVTDVNLIAFMSKNANGNILRGTHKIKITPNSLTRVECSFQIRLFTNARGGGQY